MNWLKELLKNSALDETKIDEIVSNINKELPKHFIPKDKFNEVNEAKKQLEADLKERDNQLADIKKNAGDNEELKKQIEALQADNKKKDEEYQVKLRDMAVNTAIKLAVAGEAHDPDLIVTLLDKSKIEVNEDGTIKAGLDDQLKALRESKAFLFVEKKDANQGLQFKGITPPEGSSPKGSNNDNNAGAFGKMVADFVKGNEGLQKAGNKYFE